MNLHPIRELLVAARRRNEASLEVVTAALDDAIQYVYAENAKRFPPMELDGNVLGMNVRNQMFWYAQHPVFQASTFVAIAGRNRSVILRDREHLAVRLRKHPRRRRKGQLELVPVTPPQDQLTGPDGNVLFGAEDYDQAAWEPALLWDPDPATQTLRAAWLGALEKDTETPRVFDRITVSIGSPTLFVSEGQTRRPNIELDNFDDMFPAAGTGDEPA